MGHRVNRVRTKLRNLGLPVEKGKDCGRGNHRFVEVKPGELHCRDCPKKKTRVVIGWEP